MEALQGRLISLQHDKSEKVKLLRSVTSLEERQGKLMATIDRFES
jgi:hypothetical protein